MKPETEFYIGWQAEAPNGIARKVRSVVLVLLALVLLVGALAVLNQRGFATSTFEYGQPTSLEGILMKKPAPFLQVFRGNDVSGAPVFQNILLVAPGKHGAGEMLAAIEAQRGHALDGRMVKLSGFLIYHDSKTLMEVERMDGVMETVGSQQSSVGSRQAERVDSMVEVVPLLPVKLGSGAVLGEITDPKCLFGVMKPGEGKPHRSCAARCIAGGIPPVLKTTAPDGQTQYYLLAGEKGQPVNAEILPYVGESVQVCGDIYRVGDWLLLYKDAEKTPWRVAGVKGVKTPVCR